MRSDRTPLPVFPVMLETLAFSLDRKQTNGTFLCRRRAVPMAHAGSTLEQVRSTVGLNGDTNGTLAHGTSWRVADGAAYLTWVVAPDPAPDGEGQILTITPDLLLNVSSGSLENPTPDPVEVLSVAIHALQHLAWMQEKDPEMFAEAKQQDLWQVVRCIPPVRARGV